MPTLHGLAVIGRLHIERLRIRYHARGNQDGADRTTRIQTLAERPLQA
jgi:hypothetical protein